MTGRLIVVYYESWDGLIRQWADVYMLTSEDNGATWSKSHATNFTRLTSASTDETTSGANALQYGDYIGMTAHAGTCVAAWTDRRDGLTEQIWAKRFTFPIIFDRNCDTPSTTSVFGQPYATLTSATITFRTGAGDYDNKDHGTHLRVDLCTSNDEIAAYLDTDWGEFFETADDVLPLQMNGPWFTQSAILEGYVHIRIDTRGDDTWVFNYTLRLTYSNGDTTSVDAPVDDQGSLTTEALSDEHRTRYIRTRDGVPISIHYDNDNGP